MFDTAVHDAFTPIPAPIRSLREARPRRVAQASGHARLRRARALDRRMRARTRRRQRDLAANAFDLWELSRQCLWAELGYAGLGAYAWDAHGYRASKTSDLVAIARACRERPLPKVEEAFRLGELPLSKLSVVARQATPATEESWLEEARTSTLEALRRRARGEPERTGLGLRFNAEQRAWIDDYLNAARKAGGTASGAEALAELCRRGLGQAGGELPRRRPRLRRMRRRHARGRAWVRPGRAGGRRPDPLRRRGPRRPRRTERREPDDPAEGQELRPLPRSRALSGPWLRESSLGRAPPRRRLAAGSRPRPPLLPVQSTPHPSASGEAADRRRAVPPPRRTAWRCRARRRGEGRGLIGPMSTGRAAGRDAGLAKARSSAAGGRALPRGCRHGWFRDRGPGGARDRGPARSSTSLVIPT